MTRLGPVFGLLAAFAVFMAFAASSISESKAGTKDPLAQINNSPAYK